MLHLTLTGRGSTRERMLCQTAPAPSESFWHAAYARPAHLADQAICPACLAVWTTEEADDDA